MQHSAFARTHLAVDGVKQLNNTHFLQLHDNLHTVALGEAAVTKEEDKSRVDETEPREEEKETLRTREASGKGEVHREKASMR